MPEAICIQPRWAWWVVSVGGLGALKPAPGTWGSLPPVVLLALFQPSWPWLVLGLLLVLMLAALALPVLLRSSAVEDPSWVVIDETAGVLVACLLLPQPGSATWWTSLALALVLFRVFDIAKPWPIAVVERLPGAWGVMADDLLAGVAAAVCTIILCS